MPFRANFRLTVNKTLNIPVQVDCSLHGRYFNMQLDLFIQGRALVVGVANYPLLSTLPETVLDDARDVAALLRSRDHCGYLDANVEVLLDAQATTVNIKAGLVRLAQSAGPDDTVVVFFSGHGGRVEVGQDAGAYLIPFDCDPCRLRDTAINSAELTGLLSAIKAPRLVVLLDACHSAGAGDLKGFTPAGGLKVGFDETTYSALARGSGRVIMASSRSTEVSLVLEGMRNSLFTHYLLDALRGGVTNRGDGLVRVFDVFHYVSDRVPTKAAQHPIFKAQDMENNFPLALYLGGKQIPASMRSSLSRVPSSVSILHPKARLAIKTGLVTRWDDLADYFGIPLSDKAKFQQGHEPQRILEWLEERRRLDELRDAFNYFGWDDLIEELSRNPQ